MTNRPMIGKNFIRMVIRVRYKMHNNLYNSILSPQVSSRAATARSIHILGNVRIRLLALTVADWSAKFAVTTSRTKRD